ncbi:ATP-dependent Clp protease proteolytic subunit [Pseudobutyrivibrio sp.]|uniref:ATP-dependent Clp protease proteolytic subunit n=1 Tax=Pseudobutyrivibrio sp. TaxID=2014367 RepID=UPI00386E85B3
MNENALIVSIPSEIADIKLPDPDLLRTYKCQENRIIYVDYIIDEDFLQLVGNQIIEYNIQDKGKPVEERKPIVILINSGGGNLDTANAVVAIIERSVTPVITVNLNSAHSSAGLILLAGHKRYCMPRSQMLIHKGSASGISGNFDEIQDGVKSYKKLVDDMVTLICEKSAIDKKTITNKCKPDWFLDVTQQLSYGCVDKIVDNLDEIIF